MITIDKSKKTAKVNTPYPDSAFPVVTIKPVAAGERVIVSADTILWIDWVFDELSAELFGDVREVEMVA